MPRLRYILIYLLLQSKKLDGIDLLNTKKLIHIISDEQGLEVATLYQLLSTYPLPTEITLSIR